MNFGDVISKAWNTAWKHKVLWIFGFFASLLASSGNGGSNNGSGFTWREDFSSLPQQMPRFFNNFGENITASFDGLGQGEWIALGLGIFVIAIIFIAISLFLGHLGRGAVVKGAAMAADDSKLKFGQLWKAGLHSFWKLVGLTGLTLVGILMIVIVVVLLSVITLGVGAIIFACLALPIIIAVALWLVQTTVFIVVDDETVMNALAHAWTFVFEQHLGNYLLMGLILVFIELLAGIVIALPALILGIPTALALFSNGGIAALGIVVAIIAVVIYLPFWIAAKGLLTSFTWSCWVYFYQDLIEGDAREVEELQQVSLPVGGEMV